MAGNKYELLGSMPGNQTHVACAKDDSNGAGQVMISTIV